MRSLLGAQRAAHVPAACRRLSRQMGRGLSGAAPRRGADHRRRCKLEETRFRETLDARAQPARRGSRAPSCGEGDRLDGEAAFKLYDTYGFPLDLTQDALQAARRRCRHGRVSARRWSDRRPRRASTGRARVMRRPKTIWFEMQGQGRRHRFPRLRYRDRRGRDPVALVRDGKQVRHGRASTVTWPIVAQPDAVLW